MGLDLFFEVIIAMAISVVVSLLTPKPKYSSPTAARLNDFDFPTATEDRSIPVIWGTVRVFPNCVWAGDFLAQAITKNVSTGLFASQTVILGYNYYVGMALALCIRPIDQLQYIFFDTTPVFVPTSPVVPSTVAGSPTTITVQAQWSAPGDTLATGASALVDIMQAPYVSNVVPGNFAPSAVNAYLASQLGASNTSAGVGATYLVWRGASQTVSATVNIMGTNYPKTGPSGWIGDEAVVPPISAQIKRLPKLDYFIPYPNSSPNGFNIFTGANGTWLPAWQAYVASTSDINGNSNPAWVLAELLTDPLIGVGLPGRALNRDSFVAAAQTLFNETSGFSYSWETAKPATDLIKILCRHMNGILRRDAQGRLQLQLLRSTDPVAFALTPSNCTIETFSRTAVSQTVTEVAVPFADAAANYQPRFAIATDPAQIEFCGGTPLHVEAQFEGVTDATCAATFADRELRALSAGLVQITAKATLPLGTYLSLGDVITLTSSTPYANALRCRVLKIDYSESMTQATISMIQDVFSAGNSFFANIVGPTSSSFQAPAQITTQGLILAPYAFTASDQDHALYYGVQPNSTATDSLVLSWNEQNPWNEAYTLADTRDRVSTAIQGTLLSPLAASATGYSTVDIVVDAGSLAYFNQTARSNVYVIIDGEFVLAKVLIQSASNIRITSIARGLFDTSPMNHNGGAIVVLLIDYEISAIPLSTQIASNSGNYVVKYQGDAYLAARGQAAGPSGLAALSGASYTSIAVSNGGRAAQPLPPAAVKLNGTYGSYTSTGATTINGILTLTWAPKNRLLRQPTDWYTGDGTGEANCSTIVQVQQQSSGSSSWTNLVAPTIVATGTVIGGGSATNENLGTVSPSQTVFLAHAPVAQGLVIRDSTPNSGTTTQKVLVNGTDYGINYTTGAITFATSLPAGLTFPLLATYTYTSSSTGSTKYAVTSAAIASGTLLQVTLTPIRYFGSEYITGPAQTWYWTT